jgi:signal recognition particle subunit SRP19|tara:strand:+ start:107 stop:553 length:447 start_codon:yes stop_codon:yes gene_type:complete
MTDHNPDRIVLWPGYFNIKLSRTQGRRVSKESAVSDPTLDTLALAARNVGLSKMKREADTQHPKRASQKEGRLWLSKKDLQTTLGTTSKESVMQTIGSKWRGQQRELKEQEIASKQAGPKVGDKQARSQRKQIKSKGPKRQKKQKWKF